jgi:hypothetical protein
MLLKRPPDNRGPYFLQYFGILPPQQQSSVNDGSGYQLNNPSSMSAAEGDGDSSGDEEVVEAG